MQTDGYYDRLTDYCARGVAKTVLGVAKTVLGVVESTHGGTIGF